MARGRKIFQLFNTLAGSQSVFILFLHFYSFFRCARDPSLKGAKGKAVKSVLAIRMPAYYAFLENGPEKLIGDRAG
ncbi:MAG: hypothetical protein D6715_05095 [Calditrichaeota bacterium]|nr:MAG: hypothetical protein D6715_05095 [Calditrichota bacterium]